MKKTLIFGAGQIGSAVYEKIKDSCDVIGFLDSNPDKVGQRIGNASVLGDADYLRGSIDYDRIVIASNYWYEIKSLLIEKGVLDELIEIDVPTDVKSPARDMFLQCYSLPYRDTTYAVAEGGVFRGEFASTINRCFPQSKLYLFDTFEGFDKRDCDVEKDNDYSTSREKMFGNTSVELVMSKMTYPDNVEVHKGFFPESAAGVEDRFCFVNLDFDLYSPILEGLRFFWPQMIDDSVILVHDYYNYALKGVKEAIRDFESEIRSRLIKIPIGDGQSIAIIKR